MISVKRRFRVQGLATCRIAVHLYQLIAGAVNRLKAAMSDRCAIERELGSGRMATGLLGSRRAAVGPWTEVVRL
jgi:hypothetical protein